MQASVLKGGFGDAPPQAARAFRALMQAMARPGTPYEVTGAAPPAPMSPAAGVVALTLCDPGTPVFLAGDHDCDGVREWLRFHTGAPLTDRAGAMFAFGTWAALAPLDPYATGTAEYPDRSATLIVEGTDAGVRAILRGPGIRDTAHATLPEIAAFRRNAQAFPHGLDFIFTRGATVMALPRTTKVEAG